MMPRRRSWAFIGTVWLCLLCAPAFCAQVAPDGCQEGTCHQSQSKAKFIHGPVGARQCTPCHKPKAGYDPQKHTAEAFTMAAEGKNLCLGCHEALKQQLTVGHGHSAMIKNGCLPCHDPHQSDVPSHLRDARPARLCAGCHQKWATRFALSTSVHGPIKEGKCEPCHNPHSSICPNLLKKCDSGAAAVWGGPQNAASVSLCWVCHPEENLLNAVQFKTAFHNGGQNLHRLHVVTKRPPQNHPCKRCHLPHGSSQPKLLLDDVIIDRGVWSFPMRFQPKADGGSCVTECHRAISYDRRNPVQY